MVKLFTVIRSLYEFVASSANDLLLNETDGISVWGGGTDGVANIAVLDSGTPANNISNGNIHDYFTNGTFSPKLCLQSDGTYNWSPHNYVEHSDDISLHQFANGITSRTSTTVTLNSAAGAHRTAETVILGDDETVTLAAEFKPGTHDYVTLGIQGNSDHATVVADLSSTGSISETNTQGSATIVSSGVSDAGGGWFLVQMTAVLTSTLTDYYKIGAAQSATGNTFNGTADVTFTSAGTETFDVRRMRMCKGSELVTFMSTSGTENFGVAVDYDTDESAYGILHEPTVTNRVTHGRDLSNAAWTKTNITAAKDATDIFGLSNGCSTLTSTAANGTCTDAITDASADRTFSALIKRKTGTGTIEMTLDGGTTWQDVTSSINSSTFTRIDIQQSAVTDPTVGFRIVTSGDAIFVDMCQEEDGDVATSPILTNGSTVTRDQDEIDFNFPTWGAHTTGDPASMLVDFKVAFTTGATNRFFELEEGSTEYIRMAAGSGPDLDLAVQPTSSFWNLNPIVASFAGQTRYKLGLRIKTNSTQAVVNGTDDGTDTNIDWSGIAWNNGSVGFGSDVNATTAGTIGEAPTWFYKFVFLDADKDGTFLENWTT